LNSATTAIGSVAAVTAPNTSAGIKASPRLGPASRSSAAVKPTPAITPGSASPVINSFDFQNSAKSRWKAASKSSPGKMKVKRNSGVSCGA
jgi:hypothetical protein